VGPLENIRVVDFTAAMAGPMCTMLLADFGAKVIKVEPPDGDYGRRWGQTRFGPKDDQSGLFVAMNRNKASIVADLKDPADKKLVHSLIAGADVVVENYKPGVADRLGVGYADARGLNAEIVYCSISGFGQTGPMRERPGLDMLMQAYVGHMSVTGEPGRPSVRIGPSPIDMLAGTNGALGIVMALFERQRSGRGQYIDTSLYEASVEMVSHFIADYTGGGPLQGKSGQYFAFSSPYGIFNASDREFYLGAAHQRAFTRLCAEIGRPELTEDPRFAANADRIRNRQQLHEILFPIFQSRTAAEWVQRLTELGIPASVVNGLDEVVEQPQAAEREIVVGAGIGTVKSAGFPVKLSETPAASRRPSPHLGADNDFIRAHLWDFDSLPAFGEVPA
jgi:crotonobetainyl-CoA:carnitine CoA-transferase CaiB-like acyl-CoA transferase